MQDEKTDSAPSGAAVVESASHNPHVTVEIEFADGHWFVTCHQVSGLCLGGPTLGAALEPLPEALGTLAYINEQQFDLAMLLLTPEKRAELDPIRLDGRATRDQARKFLRDGDSHLIGDLVGAIQRLEKAGSADDAALVDRARQALCLLGAVPLQFTPAGDKPAAHP